MSEVVDKRKISTFSPCHLSMEVETSFSKSEKGTSYLFESQESNLKNIFSNHLENKDNKKMKTMTGLTEDIEKNIFSSISQKQLVKEMSAMKEKQLSVSYDQAEQNNPSVKMG